MQVKERDEISIHILIPSIKIFFSVTSLLVFSYIHFFSGIFCDTNSMLLFQVKRIFLPFYRRTFFLVLYKMRWSFYVILMVRNSLFVFQSVPSLVLLHNTIVCSVISLEVCHLISFCHPWSKRSVLYHFLVKTSFYIIFIRYIK